MGVFINQGEMMRFDIRRSKVASWLNAIAALIAIAGLGSKFFPKFLPPLQQSVPIPLWALLMIVAVSPTIFIFFAKWLQPQVEQQAEETSIDVNASVELEEAKRGIAILREELDSTKSQIESYRMLENEILSILASGEEWDLNGLTGRLNLVHSEDGPRRVRLAVANLVDQKRICSTGSAPFAKLKYLAQ